MSVMTERPPASKVDAQPPAAVLDEDGTPGAGRAGRTRKMVKLPSRVGVARMVQAVGIADAITAILPHPPWRMSLLSGLVPVAGLITARAAIAVVGLLLVYLGTALRRGKRRAWQLATTLATAGVLLHLAKGLYLCAVLSLAALVVLLVRREQFTAPGDVEDRWRPLRVLGGFLGAGFLLGAAEIGMRAHNVRGHAGPAEWAEHAAWGLVGVDGPLHFRSPVVAATIAVTTGSFGLLAFVMAAVSLLRSGTGRPADTADRDERLRETVLRHGSGDSLGYFALRPDKRAVWDATGTAAVACRVVNGVSLASGDPLGRQSAWPQAIAAWLDDCARHGWTPAVLACGGDGGRAYRKAGLDVLQVGDEAIVETASFTLDGREMRAVRQAVGRMRRAGYRCTVARQRDLDAAVLDEATRFAVRYRGSDVERGFSMALSRIGDERDDDCVLVLCHDADGRLRGLLQFAPWGADGLSLDLMRGDRTAANGLTELMIVSAVEATTSWGVTRVSLNFAVLRSIFARADELGAGPVVRFWSRVLRFASRFWQIESLYRANAKYRPQWEPRYLCFPSARDLPRIALAVLRAESFLPGPGERWRPGVRRGDGERRGRGALRTAGERRGTGALRRARQGHRTGALHTAGERRGTGALRRARQGRRTGALHTAGERRGLGADETVA